MNSSNLCDDRVTISVAVESFEFTPARLTEPSVMKADRAHQIGEARGRTGNHWERHVWIVEETVCSEDHGGQSSSRLTAIALEALERRLGGVVGDMAALGDLVEVHIVLSILAEEAPGIELSPSLWRLLADSGGTF